jgi:hypothetical protein
MVLLTQLAPTSPTPAWLTRRTMSPSQANRAVVRYHPWTYARRPAKGGDAIGKLGSFYLVIIRLNTGTAIAVMTAPKTIRIVSSVVMSGTEAPNTITFLNALVA